MELTLHRVLSWYVKVVIIERHRQVHFIYLCGNHLQIQNSTLLILIRIYEYDTTREIDALGLIQGSWDQ